MTRQSEIAYMQARIARMAMEKWKLPIGDVGKIFSDYQILQHIRDCYDLYHVEGDDAIWEDLQPLFEYRGCPYA